MVRSRFAILQYLWISTRPKQWIKNVLLFAALIFSQNLFKSRMAFLSIVAFIAFCLISSAVYLLNDLMDIDKDKETS